jgi:hypothetical protein
MLEPVFNVAPGLQPQNRHMVLLAYDKTLLVPLHDYLAEIVQKKNSKYFFLSTYNSFLHLLQGINKLVENDTCYLTLSSKSIYFQRVSDLPILGHWENAIDTKLLTNQKTNDISDTIKEKERIIHFISLYIERIKDYTNQPLEVNLLFYLINNKNLITLSSSTIEEIINYYIEHCVVLQLFSPKYKNNLKDSCAKVLQKYINWNKDDIIIDLIKSVHTWDLYSLSYLYLHIVGSFYKTYRKQVSDKNTFSLFLYNWISLLNINIHPDASKRSNAVNTLEHCKNLTSFTNPDTNTNVHWEFSNANFNELSYIFD